jgi:hypothetical protein
LEKLKLSNISDKEEFEGSNILLKDEVEEFDLKKHLVKEKNLKEAEVQVENEADGKAEVDDDAEAEFEGDAELGKAKKILDKINNKEEFYIKTKKKVKSLKKKKGNFYSYLEI